jgi:hypothetical protein
VTANIMSDVLDFGSFPNLLLHIIIDETMNQRGIMTATAKLDNIFLPNAKRFCSGFHHSLRSDIPTLLSPAACPSLTRLWTRPSSSRLLCFAPRRHPNSLSYLSV